MEERFSAFSFVDRITDFEPGVRARGRFGVPRGLPGFPPCLVAEAVGQLAAWVAMAQVDFRFRPVAGLAGETKFLGDATPGQTLELEIEIDSCDDEAVAYGGRARAGGAKILELAHCVGPMLPLEEFDAPEAVRERFDVLRGRGAPQGRFRGVERLELAVIDRQAGERLRAGIQIPASGAFFADHFPRRPVFPGTLLLDAQIRLALDLASELPGRGSAAPLGPVRATDVKIRSFIVPGQAVELQAEMLQPVGEVAVAALTARSNGKPVATGRLELAPRSAA
jgi:3-hydroxymyristoyl/3-hydroxydecanoyl-(acyl carrier protein) dehydratase